MDEYEEQIIHALQEWEIENPKAAKDVEDFHREGLGIDNANQKS